MKRIKELLINPDKKLLNIFCTAGYPHLNSTIEVILSLQKHGADMIEIGMPYSDPIADGPVIQQSNMQALQNGMNMHLLFEQLNSIKGKVNIPMILMGYLNPVLQYGIEQFCADAKSAGVSGIILPDLPMFEYQSIYESIFKKHGLHFIFLITPETSIERVRKADKLSSLFLYAVSSSATTGTTTDKTVQEKYFKKLSALKLKNPLLIGFGISDHESFTNACAYAAGAIIGSAYIKVLEHSSDIDRDTASFIAQIRGKNE